MWRVSLEEARVQLLDLIEAAVDGEDVLVASGDRRTVRLVQVDRPECCPRFGSAKGLVTVADDFDESLQVFRE